MRIKRLSRHSDGLHLGLMLALTFSTGVIDAVGYLGLDRVFTANMTGNVVILGMGLAQADDLPVIGPLIALGAFVIGAIMAGRTLKPIKVGWSGRSTTLFSITGLIVLAAGIVTLVVSSPLEEPLAFTITGLLGIAMGIQAGTARHIGVKDVTTVVVTSTLVGLAFDSRLGGNSGQQWKRRLGAVVLISAGAALGALLLRFDLAHGMLVTAGITLIVALLGHLGRPPKVESVPGESSAAVA